MCDPHPAVERTALREPRRLSLKAWMRVMVLCVAVQLPAGVAEAQCTNAVAGLFDFSNTVLIRPAALTTPAPAVRDMPVCAGDTILVGQRSRARLVLLASGEMFAIDQNTEFVVRRADESGALLEILRGAVLFFTRGLRSLVVETDFVNAAVEGTEFLVQVLDDRTRITVFEGVVRATNPEGTDLIGEHQFAEVLQGQAPVAQDISVDIRPRNAVQWAVYYPPILSGVSLPQLDLVPAQERDARFYTERASQLLAVGRVADAREDIDRAIDLDATSSDAYALLAVIAVALNDAPAAQASARRAVTLDPESASARIALSYALQATFDLDAARDELLVAVENDPANGRAWARLAELWLTRGDLPRALDAAERAGTLSPGLARTQTVLGFARLAEIRLPEAAAAFEEAIRLESDSPWARLGLGLAKVRDGRLEEGRLDIEMAVALSPDDALLRSYLGKAYVEEKRDGLAAAQFDLARQLDPRDPTPWFYDAIRKQTLNRPVEALHDLQRAIELNDNRAVYRSRLLLDDDLAARGARVGRIHRDLGFEQLALLQGWKSVAADPGNDAAHRLLADNYLILPRHDIARDSELLQSQLLQPLSFNASQPRLAENGLVFLDDPGISATGLNEYARLFVADGLRLIADGIAGNMDTGAGNAVLSGIFGRTAFSVGQFYYTSDGTRRNHQLRQRLFDALLQVELSRATGIQIEFRATDTDSGDRRLLFDPAHFFPDLGQEQNTDSIRLGARHRFAADAILLGSYVHLKATADFDTGVPPPPSLRLARLGDESAHFLETRYLQHWRDAHVTAGLGHYRGAGTLRITFGPFPPVTSPSETRHTNGYSYVTVAVRPGVSATAGVSAESFRQGLLERRQANPKAGLSWDLTRTATVRVTAFRVLRRTLASSQTLEPTQVAGFNQFFDDPPASDSWRYGLAVDHVLWPGGYAGAEISERTLAVPVRSPVTGVVVDSDIRERFGRGYLYLTLGAAAGARAEYRVERIVDPDGRNPLQLARSTVHRVPLELRAFATSGLFGRVRITYVRQQGQFRRPNNILFSGRDEFSTTDVSFGFRLPGRRGLASVDVRNLFDARFSFQDTDPLNPTLFPGRQVAVRLTTAF